MGGMLHRTRNGCTAYHLDLSCQAQKYVTSVSFRLHFVVPTGTLSITNIVGQVCFVTWELEAEQRMVLELQSHVVEEDRDVLWPNECDSKQRAEPVDLC